jgi:hypothetical protein
VVANLPVQSATTSQGTFNLATGVWTVGTINSGASPATLVLHAHVLSKNPLTNTATITAADQFDPNTANNTASSTVDAP